ncbi:MAG TPA: helix-turn-helix domain-containing protein [Solirubrobacteraceae bacterium]|nr:helix-turn-helix domain-containing protein [Solirubrobacteraceae bacterium]
MPHASSESPRPLRRDAARNRQRILEAADELFRRRGLSASLNDIAHYAGVGVGTVYRHFPDKDQLVEGLFEQRFEELVRRMEEAVADPDAWHGLTSFIRFSTELQASDHAIKDLLTGGHVGLERISRIRARLMPMGEELVRRAHADGQLRQDIEAADLPVIQAMMGPLIDASAELDPDLHRRYLDIMIRGIAARPEQEPPLSTPPLALDRVDEIMVNVSSARRR